MPVSIGFTDRRIDAYFQLRLPHPNIARSALTRWLQRQAFASSFLIFRTCRGISATAHTGSRKHWARRRHFWVLSRSSAKMRLQIADAQMISKEPRFAAAAWRGACELAHRSFVFRHEFRRAGCAKPYWPFRHANVAPHVVIGVLNDIFSRYAFRADRSASHGFPAIAFRRINGAANLLNVPQHCL